LEFILIKKIKPKTSLFDKFKKAPVLRPVPSHIPKPDYALTGIPKKHLSKNEITPEQLIKIRKVGQVAREVLEEVLAAVRVGISTEELDIIAHEACIKRGGYPSPLNYRNFPKSLCTSINEVICHGIPSPTRILKDGDIINCDVTIYLDGMHGDCSETVFVGEVSEQAKKLVDTTYQCLMASIQVVKPNAKLSEIGKVISKIANEAGFSVVKDFTGHGIGEVFHMSPQVNHYYDHADQKIMKEGMVFTIEPMINAGKWQCEILSDDWTAVTIDQKLSAQFEHMIYVGPNGAEILTNGQPFYQAQLKA
jgi:methionyl aminopeptidase